MCAKTKELRKRAYDLISTGSDKQSTYNTLKGQGITDAKLAFVVASICTPQTSQQYAWRTRIVVAILVIQAFLASLLGLSFGLKTGGAVMWIISGLMASIPLALVYGFAKNRLWAYNVYFMLTITGLASQFRGFSDDPQGTLIAFGINMVMLGYILYVRYCLFPEVAFMTPVKRDGDYYSPVKAA